MLNRDSNTRSATIYQFPAGGRTGLDARYNREAGTNLATAARVNQAICSDSWYHQAAIDESKQARDH